jgi:hypothetical protein
MWRFKFILFFIFSALAVNAQREPDSVFFVKNAATLDMLLTNGDDHLDYKAFARDSVAFLQSGAGKVLTIIDTTIYHEMRPDTASGFVRFIFRKDGKIASSASFFSDTSFSSKIDYVYLHTGQVSRIVKSYGGSLAAPAKSDTTRLVYDRTGKLFSYCEKGECIERLYNSNQQLLVKRNALYGSIRGDYTYAYDKEGRLVQRKFLEKQSGVVLCTDTIQYAFANDAKTILSEKHFIRIGNGEWIAIDEMLIETGNQQVLRYDLFRNVLRSSWGINPSGYAEYTYDSDGKLVLRATHDKSGIQEKKYLYYAGSDTIRTYQVIQEKKSVRRILSSESVIVYDTNGLILSVVETDYNIVRQRKKWVSDSGVHKQRYQWN